MNSSVIDARPDHVPAERVVDFDLYQPIRDGLDFHRSWLALRDSGIPEIVWTPRNGGHWMVLRGRLVAQVLSDHTRFSSHTVLVPKATAGEAYRFIPLSLDPPAHAPFRNLLNAGLSPRAVASIEDSIRALTVSLIEGFRARGHCDFTREFAEQLPIRIFMSIVGLPLEDTHKLKHLADQFTRPDGSIEIAEVTRRFQAYIDPIIRERRGKDGTDMLSRMINGTVMGRPLSNEEAANICIQVLVGGLDTVVNFSSFVMLFLAETPAARRELASDPDRIRGALNELARRFALVSDAREVVDDIEFEGVRLHKGDMIVAPTMLHGLDDTENPDPLKVDLSRPAIRHSSFGSGPHTCPGAHLARTEMRVLIEEWLRRIPEFAVTPGHRIEYTGGIVGAIKNLQLSWPVEAHRAAG